MVAILNLLAELARLLRLVARQFGSSRKAEEKLNAKGFEAHAKSVKTRRRIRRNLHDADGLPDSPYRRD